MGGAKKFMNAVQDGKEDEQANTIHRLRHWSQGNRYKPAQAETIANQYHLAIDAANEEIKFLKAVRLDT